MENIIKKSFLKYFILVFITLFAFSGDINKTIANSSVKFYSNLLKNLDSNSTSNDELSLQKTLLKKIIQLSNIKRVEHNITKPKNKKDYKELFTTFLKSSIKKESLNKQLKLDKDKLDTLENQIKSETNSTLTQQLFYALYKKERSTITNSLNQLDKELATIQKDIISSLKIIVFNRTDILKSLDKQESEIKELNKKIESLRIKKERFELLGKSKNSKKVSKEIEDLENRVDNFYIDTIKSLFLQFTTHLQNRDNKAFEIHKNILTLLKSKIPSRKSILNDLDNLLTKMEKSVFGTVGAIKGKGVQEVKSQMRNLWVITNKPLFNINDTPVSVFKISIALLIFITGFFVGGFYKRQIKRLSVENGSITESTRTLIANMGYYIIFLITFFIVLKVLGINLSSLALVAGALSVGIGFGLQNIISNFVSGIILMVERSIKIGDYIELNDGIRGHVVDIKMRSITINTNSNIDVIVPNQDLIQNHVINWTMNDQVRRFEIPFGVKYGTSPKKVIDVVLKAIKESGYHDIYISRKRFTRVVMTGMGDSSVNFELFVWIKGEETLYPKRTTSRFLILIYNALYENDIEIPFPQQDLHIRSISEPIPVVVKKEIST